MERMNRTPGRAVRPGMAGGGLDVEKLQLAQELELDLGRQGADFLDAQGAAAGLGQLVRPTRSWRSRDRAVDDSASSLGLAAPRRSARALRIDERPLRPRRHRGGTGPAATCRSRARPRSGPGRGSLARVPRQLDDLLRPGSAVIRSTSRGASADGSGRRRWLATVLPGSRSVTTGAGWESRTRRGSRLWYRRT